MTGFATLTSKNQMTLPAALAQYIRAGYGTKLFIKSDGKDRIILERIPSLQELRKSLVNNPQVRKINSRMTSVEIVQMARTRKPPKKLYEY